MPAVAGHTSSRVRASRTAFVDFAAIAPNVLAQRLSGGQIDTLVDMTNLPSERPGIAKSTSPLLTGGFAPMLRSAR